MQRSSPIGLLAVCAAACLTSVAPASATVLLDTPSSTFPTSGAATQNGRLNFADVPQDFSGSEAYPGTDPRDTNSFVSFTLTSDQLAGGPDVQIEFDSVGLGLFASAYMNSYDPTNLQTNWLGDQAASGNPFTNDIGFFGVTVPAGNSLVIVISTYNYRVNGVDVGFGKSYALQAENFSSSTYDPVAVPEPSSLAAVGLGLLGLGYFARRRATAAAMVYSGSS